MKNDFFKGRTLVIATMHFKEEVIAPILEEKLGVNCVVLSDLNTDALGTFTGEIERKNDPVTTAKLKCQLAMERSGADLAIASEGSFGAHPEVFFAKANDEIVLLLDMKNNLEIVGRKLSLETNFDGQMIRSWQEAVAFAEEVKFPTHGLILRKEEKSAEIFEKGIRSWKQLESLANELLDIHGEIWVETDMRAMHNPTRMHVIAAATEQLVENALSLCPECECPGFVVRETQKGLPCGLCQQPTRSVKSLVYLCNRCEFQQTVPRQDGKTEEDPMYCDFCNP